MHKKTTKTKTQTKKKKKKQQQTTTTTARQHKAARANKCGRKYDGKLKGNEKNREKKKKRGARSFGLQKRR